MRSSRWSHHWGEGRVGKREAGQKREAGGYTGANEWGIRQRQGVGHKQGRRPRQAGQRCCKKMLLLIKHSEHHILCSLLSVSTCASCPRQQLSYTKNDVAMRFYVSELQLKYTRSRFESFILSWTAENGLSFLTCKTYHNIVPCIFAIVEYT